MDRLSPHHFVGGSVRHGRTELVAPLWAAVPKDLAADAGDPLRKPHVAAAADHRVVVPEPLPRPAHHGQVPVGSSSDRTSPSSSPRSFHAGFAASISATFFARL